MNDGSVLIGFAFLVGDHRPFIDDTGIAGSGRGIGHLDSTELKIDAREA